MGHAISYKKNFKFERRDKTHFVVHGTPADCTIVGLNFMMKDNLPDIVLSGINHGDNAGNAILYSGTFGGALEAGLHRVPAISFSQLRQPDKTIDFSVSQKYFAQVMNFLSNIPWPDHVVMNVNFPPVDNHTHDTPHYVPSKSHHIVQSVRHEPLEEGFHDLSIHLTSQFIDKNEHFDLDILARGGVTITPVNTNWTCQETLRLWAQ